MSLKKGKFGDGHTHAGRMPYEHESRDQDDPSAGQQIPENSCQPPQVRGMERVLPHSLS